MTPYTKKIVELHKIHKAIENCGCNKDDEQVGDDSGSLLMSLISSDFPKPDLFLIQQGIIDYIDVTNYKIDDLINLAIEQNSAIEIMCVYESSNLDSPIINAITFNRDNQTYGLSPIVVVDNIDIREITYNNKTYYNYSENFV